MLLTWLWNWLTTLNTWTAFEWCLVGGVTLLVVGVLGVNLFYFVFPPPDPADRPPPRSTFPPAPWQPWTPGIALRREQQARLERERQASAAPPAPPAPPLVTPHPPPECAPADPPAPEADAWLRDQARPTAPQAPRPSPPVSPPGRHQAPETIILPPAPPPPRATPPSGGRKAQGLACAEAYQAIIEGRLTDLDEIRAVIAALARIQATPRERARVHWGLERALEDLEQLLAAREASDAAASSWPEGEEPLEAEARGSGPVTLAGLREEEPDPLAPTERAIGPVDPAFFSTDLDPLDLAWQDTLASAEGAPAAAAAASSSERVPAGNGASADQAPAGEGREAPGDDRQSAGEASLTLEESARRPGTPLSPAFAPGAAEEEAPSLEASGQTHPTLAGAEQPLAESNAAVPALVPAPTKAPAPLRILCFGHARLLVFGSSLGMRKAPRLQLALALAYQAAQKRGDTTFLFRQSIAAALWPSQATHEERRKLLDSCKSRLVADVREAGLEEAAWLDPDAAQNTLRLGPAVETDLAAFAQLSRQIEHLTREAWPPVTSAGLEALLAELKALYQGGFALQFEQEPWIVKARRHYRALYYAACLELARRFADLSCFREAIELGTDVLLEAHPSGDLILRDVSAWLSHEEPGVRERWASEFAREYRRLTGQTLATAQPGWEQIRVRLLRQR